METYFHTVLESGSARSRCWHFISCEGALFLACKRLPPQCVLTWQRERQGMMELSGGSSQKDTNPLKSGLHFMTLFNLITSLHQIQSGLALQHVNFEVTQFQSRAFCSWPHEFLSFSHSTYIHFIPTAPKVLTHSSINSSKVQISSKYHLNQICVRHKV